MIIQAFENWAQFSDNGIWEYPHAYSTTLFTNVMQHVRAKIIDDVIYIIRTDGPAYKIRLSGYTSRQQDQIIDNLFNLIE